MSLFRRAVAATLGSLMLSSLAAVPLPGAASAAPAPLRLVAVGDSYASGEGARGAAWEDERCHRSPLAGPADAARRLHELHPVEARSLACSGTFTGSATGAGGVSGRGRTLLGAEGQLAHVGAAGERIDALTMSIGGNDVGFADLVFACTVPVYDCSADPLVTGPVAAALAALPARLDEVAAAIQGSERLVVADVRHVFVTAYPDPTSGAGGARCGSADAPAFGGLEGIDAAEAGYASASVVAPLNAALAGLVARANDAPGPHPVWHLVDGTAARIAGHGYCTGPESPQAEQQAAPRFVATLADSIAAQGDVYGTLHLNEAGQRELGAALFEAQRVLVEAPEPEPAPGPGEPGRPAPCRICGLLAWLLDLLLAGVGA